MSFRGVHKLAELSQPRESLYPAVAGHHVDGFNMKRVCGPPIGFAIFRLHRRLWRVCFDQHPLKVTVTPFIALPTVVYDRLCFQDGFFVSADYLRCYPRTILNTNSRIMKIAWREKRLNFRKYCYHIKMVRRGVVPTFSRG
jgi:hypothetical protein